MTARNTISRRSFLGTAAAAPLAFSQGGNRPPVGLELYSVRNELQKDLTGTVTAVAKMGYEGVEFYSPYYSWTPERAKEIRKLLDDLGIKCYSTHNGPNAFTPENVAKSIDLNSILGSKIIVMASAGQVKDLDGWKRVAERLTQSGEEFQKAGLRSGFHNHDMEFRPIDGVRPLEVLARETPKQVVLQLDVGTALQVGYDPVAWIDKNPGRIASMHLKDWSPEPDKGFKVLFGEGKGQWKEIFQAAEKTGGLEYYLIEQEGSSYPPFETAERCLATFKRMRR